jgi:hypothetical protein
MTIVAIAIAKGQGISNSIILNLLSFSPGKRWLIQQIPLHYLSSKSQAVCEPPMMVIVAVAVAVGTDMHLLPEDIWHSIRSTVLLPSNLAPKRDARPLRSHNRRTRHVLVATVQSQLTSRRLSMKSCRWACHPLLGGHKQDYISTSPTCQRTGK